MASNCEAFAMELSDLVGGHVRLLRSQRGSDIDTHHAANAINSLLVSKFQLQDPICKFSKVECGPCGLHSKSAQHSLLLWPEQAAEFLDAERSFMAKKHRTIVNEGLCNEKQTWHPVLQ